MKKVELTEFKRNISRYLDQVKSGHSILLVDRRQPTAQIVPISKAAQRAASDNARLDRLESNGLIRRGKGGSARWLLKRRLIKIPGGVLQHLLDERRSGW